MPNLSDLTDYADRNVAIDPSITHIVVTPKAPEVKEPDESVIQNIFDRLTGSNGKERYQLWPEKVVREGLSAAHDAMTGETPQYTIDENTGDVHTSPQMIKAAQDMSALAGTGGLGGVGSEAGTALGSSPFLRPALKYGEKLYKGKEGQQHMDLIPNELYPEFQRQALNGEDISHWNFGFTNDKGHFLDREKALQYGIDNGIIDPQAGKFGALTSTLMADSSKPGVAIEAMANTNKPFYSAVENAVAGAKQPKADAQQWLSFLKNQPGVKQEELAHLGLDKLSGSITKDELLKAVQEGQPQIKEVVKGDKDPEYVKKVIDLDNQRRAFEREGNTQAAEEIQRQVREMPNDGIGRPKFSKYQLPGGENYREMLLTLPDKHAQHIKNIDKQFEDVNTELRILSNKNQQNTPEYEALSKQYNDLYKQRKEAYEKTGTAYQSSHWDEPNVLAHIRMNDRMIDGKKTLHLEEIQSDWHQAGRKSGYKSEADLDAWKDLDKRLTMAREDLAYLSQQHAEKTIGSSYQKFLSTKPDQAAKDEALAKLKQSKQSDEKYVKLEDTIRNLEKERDRANPVGKVPDAPFKKTWDELALKKAITEAVKGGYDSISWTPGEAQAARYDLSKNYKNINAVKRNDGSYMLQGTQIDHSTPNSIADRVPENKLADYVGKELAEKITNNKGGEFSGTDLKVGGQGMKAFYDKMLVDKMNALTKKYGGKVEKSDVSVKGKNELYQKLEDEGYNPNDVDIQNILSDNGGRLPHWLTDNELTRIEKGEHLESLGSRQPVHVLKITPELREHVLKKGFPLFSAGVPIFTPVSHNPFKDNASLPNDKNTMRPEDVQSYRTYGDNNGATQEKP